MTVLKKLLATNLPLIRVYCWETNVWRTKQSDQATPPNLHSWLGYLLLPTGSLNSSKALFRGVKGGKVLFPLFELDSVGKM